MPFPVIALAALAGGALLLASKKGASGAAAPAPTVAPTANVTLPPGTGLFDANLPLYLEQCTSRMLATDSNAGELQEFAASLLPEYPIAAAALDTKAAAFGAPPIPPQPASTAPAPQPAPVFVPVPQPMPPAFSPPPAPTPAVPPPPDTSGGAPPAASSGPPPWDPSMATSGPFPAIPTVYRTTSQETNSIQSAVNAWAATVGYPGTPLTTDGTYGPMTQQAVADFQSWHNAADTSEPALTVDGLAGPQTQTYLQDFGQLVGGAY